MPSSLRARLSSRAATPSSAAVSLARRLRAPRTSRLIVTTPPVAAHPWHTTNRRPPAQHRWWSGGCGARSGTSCNNEHQPSTYRPQRVCPPRRAGPSCSCDRRTCTERPSRCTWRPGRSSSVLARPVRVACWRCAHRSSRTRASHPTGRVGSKGRCIQRAPPARSAPPSASKGGGGRQGFKNCR